MTSVRITAVIAVFLTNYPLNDVSCLIHDQVVVIALKCMQIMSIQEQ